MKKEPKPDTGIQLLIERYKKKFRTPENMNHYEKSDFKIAEKKYIKYALSERIP